MPLRSDRGDQMKRREAVLVLLALGAAPLTAEAQQARLNRVGVLFYGDSCSAAIDRPRGGLRELGL